LSKKERRFADDGWAIWIDGDDSSTVYINDWLNPKGKSFVDLAIRVGGVKSGKRLSVYVPFSITKEEITDVSLLFNDRKVLHAIFSASCIIDYKKNEYTSEIAYNGKTVDILHISTVGYQLSSLSEGTIIIVDLEKIQPYIDNDEAYIVWRMPHKTLDGVFKPKVNVENVIGRVIDLITTPVVSEKYGYSIRINESRLLPEEITKIGAFHRQKLKKAVITISIDENYDINDANCYRIRRLEENLYSDYLPHGYKCEDVITYQWNQTRDHNLQGQFNFYYNITRDAVNVSSMSLYMVILLAISVFGEILSDIVKAVLGISF
jgi:hypothetical protein